MYSNQKNEFQCFFAMNLSFKFPASAHAQWSWPRNGRLVTNDITSGTFQSLMFLFCVFVDRIVFTNISFVCFSSTKTLNHYWNNSFLNKQDLAIPDLTSWPIQKPRLLFGTDSRSTPLGMAEAGTLKPDFRALKCRNRFFFLKYLFTHYRDTKRAKTLLAVQTL